MVGGANPPRPDSVSAETARRVPPSICWRIAKAIWCSRIDGAGSPTGRSTKHAVTWAPVGAPSPPWTETGTMARTVVPGYTDSPRVSSHERNAPATVARMTSLIVTSSANAPRPRRVRTVR